MNKSITYNNKFMSVFRQTATLPLAVYVNHSGFPCCNDPPH